MLLLLIIPNAMDPSKFKNAIHHDILLILNDHNAWLISHHASKLAIKKHIEPYTSGDQTR